MQLSRTFKLIGLPVFVEFDGRLEFIFQQMHIVVDHALTHIQFLSYFYGCSCALFFYQMNEILYLLDVHGSVF